MAVLYGTASGISQKSDAPHTDSTKPATTQNRQFTLKINNEPVLLRTRYGVPAIADGDRVAVAGHMVDETLEADAFRNLTTGACDYPAIWSAVIVAALLVLFGLSMAKLSWLGLLIIAASIWTLWRALVARETIQALNRISNDR